MDNMGNIEAEKKLAAEYVLRFLQSDSVIGLGSGSTMSYAIRAIGKEVVAGRLKSAIIW